MKVIYLQGQRDDENVEHINFPTGEKHIRIFNLEPTDDIILVYNDPSGDVMKLAMATDICRRANVNSITLVMPFVPYARQDEVYVDGDPLSIECFTALVNFFQFNRVIISDPHSKVTPALLDNCVTIHQHGLASKAFFMLDEFSLSPIAIVAPDIGAAKKAKALQVVIAQINSNMVVPVIQCDKTRDPATGQITGFKILDGDPTGHHCLMIDDICDGGGTFLGLHSVLEEAGAVGQSLYVTHGIFSKGIEVLSQHFAHLFATDSFPTPKGVHTIEQGVYS